MDEEVTMSATNAKSKPQSASDSPLSAPRTAKLFKNGRSQAVRLPKEFRFEGTAVAIRRDPATGEVILAPAPTPVEPSISFDEWFALYDAIPDDASEEEFAKLPPRPENLTTEQLFKIFGRAKYPDEFFERRRVNPQPAWEERFAVWDSLGSSNEDALERDLTPPVERDFF
jgi:antitoxin VapB